MSWREDRQQGAADRRAELRRLAPGNGLGALIDRGAWSALSQQEPESWSWRRALITVVVALAAAAVIFTTFYPEPGFLAGLVIAYGFLLYRAKRAHKRFVAGGG